MLRRGHLGVKGPAPDPDRQPRFRVFHKTQMGEIHTSAMSTSLCSAVTYSTGLGECRQSEREREDISCIISCSAKRCLSDLVHDMPPCFSVSSSLALLYMFLSLCLPVFLTDALFIGLPVFPSLFYMFPSIFFSKHIPAACSWQ